MSETELCRLCAKAAGEINAEKLFESHHRKLLRQIEQLIGQRLRNVKNLPKHICKSCEEQTLQAHAFRESCIRTQQHFAVQQKNERLQHKKAKLKEPPPVSPYTEEEVFVYDFSAVKEEKEFGASSLPHTSTTAVLFKTEPTFTADNDGSNSVDTFNPLDVDNQNTTNENYMNTIETEISLFDGDEKPISPNKSELKQRKKQKSITRTKCENSKQKPKERKFICDQCGKHFVSNSDLESHIRRHTGERLFKCEICPESFFLKVGLKRHMLKHAGELPYPCSHCERRFLDKCHAMKHERTHTNERPYICQQCGKGFTVSHILKAHLLVHTGERKFGCKLCNAAFKLKKHLVTHCRSIIHKQNEEKQLMSSIEPTIAAEQNITDMPNQKGFS